MTHAASAQTQISAPAGLPFTIITRDFAAEPELLLRAHTDPGLLARWLGPREYSLDVDRYEVRDGGRWRYVHRSAAGHEHGFHGVFHGTPSVEGIVQTFEYEGAPGHVKLDTTTFERTPSGTRLRTTSCFQSVADRDAMVASGMERGVRDSMDRLAELLAVRD